MRVSRSFHANDPSSTDLPAPAASGLWLAERRPEKLGLGLYGLPIVIDFSELRLKVTTADYRSPRIPPPLSLIYLSSAANF